MVLRGMILRSRLCAIIHDQARENADLDSLNRFYPRYHYPTGSLRKQKTRRITARHHTRLYRSEFDSSGFAAIQFEISND